MNKSIIFIVAISTGLAASAGDKITYKPNFTLAERAGMSQEAKQSRQEKQIAARIYGELDRQGSCADEKLIRSFILQRANLKTPITKKHGITSETMTVLEKATCQNNPGIVQLLVDNKADLLSISNNTFDQAYKTANPDMLDLLAPAIRQFRTNLPDEGYEQSARDTAALAYVIQSKNQNSNSVRNCFRILIRSGNVNPFTHCVIPYTRGKPCDLCFARSEPDSDKLNVAQKEFVTEVTQIEIQKALRMMPVELADMVADYTI